MLLTIGAAILVLGVLIFVHELGHFMAAKAVGIGVPRFSIGLGPPTPFSFRRGETEYVISWVPFGGYVKMATAEDSEGVDALEGGRTEGEFPPEKLFESKPLWARMVVILAGVTMNVCFAWLVYFGLAAAYGRVEDPTTTVARFDPTTLPPSAAPLADLPFGTKIARINGDTVESLEDIAGVVEDITANHLRFDFAGDQGSIILPIDGLAREERQAVIRALVPLYEARVASVVDGSAADEAGFQSGDMVIRANGDTLLDWGAMVELVRASAGQPIEFDVLRAGSTVTLTAVPRAETVPDPSTGELREVGQLGVARPNSIRRVRVGLGGSMTEGTVRVGRDARFIWFALTSLVMGRISPRELGGPVLIGQLSGQTARAGLEAFLTFMALFSVNLAILNLLPIPVLDGGQFVFLLMEGVRGKPLSLTLRIRLTQAGLFILLGIMALALTNDFLRLFGM